MPRRSENCTYAPSVDIFKKIMSTERGLSLLEQARTNVQRHRKRERETLESVDYCYFVAVVLLNIERAIKECSEKNGDEYVNVWFHNDSGSIEIDDEPLSIPSWDATLQRIKECNFDWHTQVIAEFFKRCKLPLLTPLRGLKLKKRTCPV